MWISSARIQCRVSLVSRACFVFGASGGGVSAPPSVRSWPRPSLVQGLMTMHNHCVYVIPLCLSAAVRKTGAYSHNTLASWYSPKWLASRIRPANLRGQLYAPLSGLWFKTLGGIRTALVSQSINFILIITWLIEDSGEIFDQWPLQHAFQVIWRHHGLPTVFFSNNFWLRWAKRFKLSITCSPCWDEPTNMQHGFFKSGIWPWHVVKFQSWTFQINDHIIHHLLWLRKEKSLVQESFF